MATLLMVESWLHSTGECLPPIIRALGHRYLLFTRDPNLYPARPGGAPHPVIGNADEIIQVDTNDDDAVSAAAFALTGRRPVDGVLTTCDYYLDTVALLAERLGLPGAPPEVMRQATRKHLVRQAFWEITSGERNTRGQPRDRLVLLEELVHGRELSVEAVTQNGITTILGITDKSIAGPPAFVESGHMFPAQLSACVAREVETFVRGALDAIGYSHGLSHTEVMLTSDGPRVVEINPRQAGGHIFDLIHLVAGTHPLELLVHLSLGHTPPIGTATAPLITAHPRAASAAIFFVMSPQAGLVQGVEGTEGLDNDPDVLRWTIPLPAHAQRPRSNDAYLGHVLTVDPIGRAARAKAEAAVGALRLRLAGSEPVRPIGVPSGVPSG